MKSFKVEVVQGKGYRVMMAHDHNLWSVGTTIAEAIGALVLTHPEEFGVDVASMNAPKGGSHLSGRANCGCVHHAEDGTPCVHDLGLMSGSECSEV